MHQTMKKEIKWSIDQAHSNITFKVRHLMISHVTGSFKTFDASIYTTGKDFSTAVIDIWIEAASIETGDTKRDEHLIGEDFFDTQDFKQITFVSSTIQKADADGTHDLWGELSMHGITKNVKLEVVFGGLAKDHNGHEKAGFSVTGKIKRSEWGLIWNAAIETGGLIVSDEITINCDVELINLGEKNPQMVLETDQKLVDVETENSAD
jgi:polyisoprenoid-binding protein YceI